MAFHNGPKTTTDNVIFSIDAGNPKSYSGSGTSSLDLAGNKTGELINTVVFNGDHWTFNAVDERIEFDTLNLERTVGHTIELVYSVDSLFSTRTIISNTDNSGNRTGWSTFVNTDGSIFYNFLNDSAITPAGRLVVSTDASVISINTVYHVSYTYDGSGLASGMKIYVNGESKPLTIVVDDGESGSTTSNQPLFVGEGRDNSNAPSSALLGDIYMAKVYNIELTADEIQSHFDALRKRFGL